VIRWRFASARPADQAGRDRPKRFALIGSTAGLLLGDVAGAESDFQAAAGESAVMVRRTRLRLTLLRAEVLLSIDRQAMGIEAVNEHVILDDPGNLAERSSKRRQLVRKLFSIPWAQASPAR
jgi:hypothetical protein